MASPRPEPVPRRRLGLVQTAGLVIALGAAADALGSRIAGINAVVVALALGVLVANLADGRLTIDPRVSTFMLHRALKLAVILLGAGIDLTAIARVGPAAGAIIAATVASALGISWWMGRSRGLHPRSALLIGVGTAICGASAIAAVAPVLEAEQEEVGVALATVFSFNALALMLYPVIGAALGLGQVAFGTWAGIGVHDTASSVATGFAFGVQAGQVATVVKLARTLFLLPLLAITVAVVRKESSPRSTGRALRANIPWFILGFTGLATLNTLGRLGGVGTMLDAFGKTLIIFVVVAVGSTLVVKRVASIGRPLFLTGMVASVAAGALSLGAIELLRLR